MNADPSRKMLNLTDLFAGLGVTALCSAFALVAYGYGLGGLARMGAGFFPFWFGVLGAVLGVVICIGAFRGQGEGEARIQWRSLLFVSASFVMFGLLIEPVGLVATVVVSTVLGARADQEARLGESALLGLGLAAGVWVVFVLLLGLAIPVLPEVL
ncbi:hypothetical protein C2I36_08325 [Rhodobacteraceae bacterium WD3A24]|nr:hypothetical protein C2I36_08325 [Rhodobacteraceae bacterium WD3A24]